MCAAAVTVCCGASLAPFQVCGQRQAFWNESGSFLSVYTKSSAGNGYAHPGQRQGRVQENSIPSLCTLLLDVHTNVLCTHLFPSCMYLLVGNGSLHLSGEQHPPGQESWSRSPVLAGNMHWGGSGKTVIRSDQIRSVAQLCPTLCDPMNCSTPGLPVHHQLLEFTQTHVHQVSDVIQPSHPLSSPSPSAPNPSQHQSLFQ